ncbi:PSD1 and planctomycete cytochrome C domain-containing protein [Fimbriiglobus ruber]|uniref:Cytochrome C n=1 Tax=Fimbriiglobus ruber TaxID=1908690 RepID=A0A225DUG8_9BACT|nr:PSD1 and planctomycete cytochrome C domain-containing protein [Fimbriiglobus ruber]OWK44961.1 cytochrome C [Fimbriiglobus ruber]
MLSARLVAPLVLLAAAIPIHAAEPGREQAEFFEKKIRPVLVEHCFKCHSEKTKAPKGGLRVDGRGLLLKGGDGGPALVPGDPDKSKLVEAVRFKNNDMQMPPKGKLPDAVVADLEAWVRAGAVWPNDATAGTTEAPAANGFDLQKRKREHWAWAPVTSPSPPAVKNTAWASDPIDRFILAKLEEKNLKPAAPADKLVWLRRVTFTLTGLPPTPEEIAAFQKDATPGAAAAVVDRLLASPAYGERWARHWLDLVRYAESRGHEFEPDIPNAYQYRDYVVRAINADVPYNQFVRENLAGDVVPNPRLNPADGFNESVIGTGFWHLGEEVHSPVDLRQDQADRFDNRIDVMTKTFLGLTVACARCHDHKFDAIATKDYYALFGLLEGSSYRQVRFDSLERNKAVAADLAALRDRTTTALAAKARGEIAAAGVARGDAAAISTAAPKSRGDDATRAWLGEAKVVVDYANLAPGEWLPDDVTFGPGPRRPGDARVRGVNGKPVVTFEERATAAFDGFWDGLKLAPHTAGDNGGLARQQRAGFTIRTPNIVLEHDTLYYLVRGSGLAYAGVCGHTIIHGPLHGSLVTSIPAKGDEYQWVAHKLTGYKGQRLQVELTAAPGTDFAVAMVVQASSPPPGIPAAATEPAEWNRFARTPKAAAEFAAEAMKFVEEEKKLAARVKWESRLAPALFEGTGVDDTVFVRGNPRAPGEVVPHRLLEALAGTERIAHSRGSGRLELAAQITDPARNPFAARVEVNRVWHHLFGRGIVASTDNFGLLGEPPTHPELLDYLATEFVRDGWSTRRLIRRLALTSAYRMSVHGDASADQADPANLLLHKFRLKRIEGEAIRDAMLSVSGRLDRTAGGPPVPIYLTPFLDGRGRPGSGPLDGDGRRSLYLSVRRNFLSPFLLAFDTPIPFSTVGRRQVSNVPAQSLILLNDPFVHQQAGVWAKKVLAAPGSVSDRVTGMYVAAYGRPPTADEITVCGEFVQGKETDAAAWTALAHALFNVKEFIYVQ